MWDWVNDVRAVPFPSFFHLSTLGTIRDGTTAEGTLAPLPPQSQCLAAAGYPWLAEK